MSERSAFSHRPHELSRTLDQGICQDLAAITLFCEAMVGKLRLQKSPLEQEAIRVRDLLEKAKQDLRGVSSQLQKSGERIPLSRLRGISPTGVASRGEA